MAQTQIELTDEEIVALKELAKKREISLPELIHEGIGNLLRSAKPDAVEQRQRALAIVGRFRSGLRDLSTRHDDYLAEALDT